MYMLFTIYYTPASFMYMLFTIYYTPASFMYMLLCGLYYHFGDFKIAITFIKLNIKQGVPLIKLLFTKKCYPLFLNSIMSV